MGGRIYTGRTQTTPIDLGAAWIHGPERNLMADWALEELGEDVLKLKETSENSAQFCIGEQKVWFLFARTC